ncbi:hypothetical protein AB0C74_11960 [Spirillospora sp. NPDC048832]
MSHTIKIDDKVAALLERSRKHPGQSIDAVLRRWLGLPLDTPATPDAAAPTRR